MGEREKSGRTRRVALRVSEAEDRSALADVLRAALARAAGHEVPRSRVRALIAAGAVLVDGRPLRVAARPVRAGQRVQALVRLAELRPATERTDAPFRLGPESVLYRDRWLLAVSKPPGLPTHATVDPARASLAGHVERLLAEAGQPPVVAIHQRLDRDTSGVVLFAVDPQANGGLARAFEERTVEKTYAALTARGRSLPPPAFRVDVPLAAGGPPTRPVCAGGPGARTAQTDVAVREVMAGALLVEARPRTGRKHQVRVHLADSGLPILGDPLYGDGSAAPRPMLHAARLALEHPVTGERLVIDCPLPPDFAALLARLRSAPR